MIVEGMVLAGSSVAVEMITMAKIPAVRHIVANSDIASLVFSTGLSWLTGWLFGATGLTVLLAALGSTVVSWLIYRGMRVATSLSGGRLALA